MIASIAIKETRALLRDGRLWTLGLVLTLLFIAVLVMASHQRDSSESERHQVETASRQQWDNQGDKNPHRAAHFGMYAFKPRSMLSSVEPGVDAQAGQALWLEPHKRNMGLFAPAADVPSSIGLGPFTPGFVLLALVPLLIAVLGHGTITQERESGTLRMLHACGMRGSSLVFGKWLGICAGLGIVLAPMMLAGAWVAAGQQDGRSVALLGIALFAYYATWVGMTAVVSAYCKGSRTALLVLIGLWVAWIFVIPKVAASTVERIYPLPTGDAFWTSINRDIEHGLPGDTAAAERMKAYDTQLLADNGVTRLEDLPFGANAKRRLFRDAYSTKVHALHFAQLWEREFHQERLLRWLSVISPYAPMNAISAALSGTDLAHRHHFEEAAEVYRKRFTTVMDEWDLNSTKGVKSFEEKYAGNDQWKAVPSWSYATPDTNFALAASSVEWGQLVAWLVLVLLSLWHSSRRLNP